MASGPDDLPPHSGAEPTDVQALGNGADPLVGQVIAGRYQVLGLLGRGGMGSVYTCEHVQLKKRMALKVLSEELRRQPELVARFLKEARAAAQIGHPNIVDVYDLGELPDGGAYIAMALLEGHDLADELDSGRPLAVARTVEIVAQICRALAVAHAKGIVHRDMKPGNIFIAIDPDGGETAKLLDFGIAQVNEIGDGEAARLTRTGAIVGTPSFMSPEQGRGDRADNRTDIYAVGCILFNMLTGRVPFHSNTLMGIITRHLFDPPDVPSTLVPLGTISPALDAVVLRAMAKAPADRFQTMKEMWTALEAAAGATSAWPEDSSGRFERTGPASVVRPSMASYSDAMARTLAPEEVAAVAGLAPARSRVPLFVVLALVVAALAAAAVIRRPSTPNPPPHEVTVVPTPTPPARANDVAIEVRSTPDGATVLDGERIIGKTPLRLTRAQSASTLALRLRLDDFRSESLDIALDHDRLVAVDLSPAQPTTTAKPSSKPAIHSEPKPSKPAAPPDHPTTGKPRVAGKDGNLKDPFQ